MKKRVSGLIALFFVVGLISGCAFIAEKTRGKTGVGGGLITGGVASLTITGPTRGSVGEVVTFEAQGYDSRAAAIKRPGAVNPEWSIENSASGKLNSKKGRKVTMKCLAPGVVTIVAKQGKAEEAMTMIEIK
ncbi:MAG: hypothetical protein U9O97_01900 [Elusimicrobiota bacterium]|nr:hypothetical protein [Elusimicrobiota bacterium]